MQSRSAGGPVLGAPGPPRPRPRPSIWSLGKAPPPRRGSAWGWGGSPPPARSPARPPRAPAPPGNPATPAPPPGQLTWLARPLPARRPVSGPPGPRAARGAGAAAAGRWCWGLITMRKAVPGKASSTRLSISLSGGGGAGRGPRRSHRQTWRELQATQARGGGLRPKLGGCWRAGRGRQQPRQGIETPPTFLSPHSLPLARLFSPSCPFSLFSWNSFPIAFPTFSFLSVWSLPFAIPCFVS